MAQEKERAVVPVAQPRRDIVDGDSPVPNRHADGGSRRRKLDDEVGCDNR